MICCLNPKCRNPLNADDAKMCQGCGSTLIPSLRGRYRAVQPIGQGGFGRTYLALDEDRLNMRCVIKQFSPQVQGEKSLEKAIQLFNQEAVRLHELGEHAQIPTLLAYFEHETYLYLVQQFIEGQNLLQQMRQQGGFNERQIRDVLADLLPVLRFIHNKQVIHRDITPMNILRRQSDDRLILIDFGVSKQINAETAAEAGTRIGTEGYAPLEQFRSGRAYPASDLYSLGATCLHLMCETKPDNLYDPLNGTWIWRDYLQNKGVRVSDQLAHILDMMLKDLVNDRYQSADEVMRDLHSDFFIPTVKATKPVAPAVKASAVGTPATPGMKSSSPPSPPPTPSVPPVAPPPPIAPPSSSKTSNANPPTSRPFPSRPPIVSQSRWKCLHTLAGHSSWVTALAVSPNGTILASSSLDDTIKVWSLQRGDLLATMTGHHKGVNAIAISPNGKLLTSGSDDYTLKTWNLQNGALLRTLTGHSRDVNAVVVSPDGQILVSGGEDRTVRLWQMGTGNVLKTLLGVGSMIKSLAISPDNRTLFTGGFDNKIKRWNMQTGEQLGLFSGHLGAIHALAVSADGQLLASASKDKTVKLWNVAKGEVIRTLSGHTRDVNAIVLSPDSRLVISGSSDTTVKVWNVQTGEAIDTISGHADSVNAIALSPNGKILVTGSSDNTIRVWQSPF